MGGCPEGEFCPSSPEEAYCTKIPIKKEEGEECTKQEECKSSICEENKCKTLADGEECKKHYHCGQFSYCDEISSQCKPLVKKGGKCNTSFECGFDLACANFVCKKMFSLPTGEATDNWQVCQTGRSFELSTGEYCVEKKQILQLAQLIMKKLVNSQFIQEKQKSHTLIKNGVSLTGIMNHSVKMEVTLKNYKNSLEFIEKKPQK